MQLLRNMNRLLDKHPQSRRRHLAWHTPIIVPVYPQVRSVAFLVHYPPHSILPSFKEYKVPKGAQRGVRQTGVACGRCG
jgi:phosphatidylinositol kinase/protein kinase (PI-3  family)